MEQDAVGDDGGLLKLLNDSDERPRSAVNSVILDYYKKFGRKRDLEQYFSLSTAQSDIRDPRSLFWRRMKEQSDTSDGEKKSEGSSNEICRISIKCSIPERSEVENRDSQSNNDSESPPIITDVLPMPSPSADESIDDDHSQKSADGTLDTSVNKPLSPTSSITSQRKLEWDSLADVGYGNESDRKTSASSLSTLEREVLALKQQYTLNYKQASDLGIPTAHSTPVDTNDDKLKGKKGQGKKTISISRKDVDFVEVSVPRNVENAQPINVNLTKQFSVNLQQDGGLTIDDVKKDITISPEKNIDDTELNTRVTMDKEIQTSLLRSKDRSSVDCANEASTSTQKAPILISLNTLKWKQRRKKIRNPRTKLKTKKKFVSRKKVVHEKDKSGEQVSEAESFEYMPGHIYNQNQLRRDPIIPSNNNAGNKSSLESSAVHTTDSSKESKYSFSKDLDKTLNVLKSALKEKYDTKLKNKLVTEIINRLLKSKYGEGEQTPDFLSVLSLASRKTPTTSTSEADNTDNKVLHSKPKKSILRVNKFDPNNVASTSQSAPNLTSVVNNNETVMSYLPKVVSSTTTETDLSNNSAKDLTSSDTVVDRTSSEQLYKKYIDALKREEAYKQHLRDKELFLRQKLVGSENALKVPTHVRTNNKLKELIKDLTRNNYDDGSGDASKLEGGSSPNFDFNRKRVPRKHRSHSVFTLSSGNSDVQNRSCLKNRLHNEIMNSPRAGPSNRGGNSAGSFNRPPVAVADSSVQVNINLEYDTLSRNPPNLAEQAKYVCLCTEKCQIQDPTPKSKTGTIPACSIHPASSSLDDDGNTKLRGVLPKKEKTIIECTKCLQTKISLQPKISDPSVSDINLIHSADCVKLINELYMKVSQPNSECQCSNEKEDSNSNTCKSSKDYIGQNRDERDNLINDGNELEPLTNQQTEEQNINQACCIGCQKIFTNQPESISDNIVIPIQGTNMMLKVSIGGKTMQVKDEQIPTGSLPHRNVIDKEIATDEIKTSLKGTSISDECSKFVQAVNAGDIGKNIYDGAPCGINKEISNREKQVLSCNNTGKERQSKQCKNDHVYTYNDLHTYPKKVQICDKKPFLRSNTETGNLGANSAIQTKTICNKQNKTQPCFRTETHQVLSPRKHSRSEDDYVTDAQTIKIAPSVHSTSESSNYSSVDRCQRYNTFKDKSTTEIKDVKDFEIVNEKEKPKDLILGMIEDITKRYSKKDTGKRNKKKCFKEIVTALSYLLDTDDSGDGDQEFSKKSQSSKGSREQSSQSELIANHILNEAQSSTSALCQRNSNSSMLTDKSNKSIKPQKSTTETCGKNKKTESQNLNRSNKSCGENSDIVFSKPEQAVLKSTCEMGCGCDGSLDCKDCMGHPSAKPETGNTHIESSRSEKSKTGSALVRETTFEMARNMVPRSTEFEADSSGNKLCRFEKQETEIVTDTWNKESLKPTKYEFNSNASNKNKTTCDMGCGCDGSSDCKDCVEHHPRKSPQESSRPKFQYQETRCESTKKTSNTWDDEVVSQSSKYGFGTCGKQLAKFEEQVVKTDSPGHTKTTCDKGCGCDGSKECEDCMVPHSPKLGVDRCSKEPVKSKKEQGRCGSAKKTKMTCDKGCGYDGSKECEVCLGPHSSKYGIDRCTKASGGSKKQEGRCGSPEKVKTTCDKSCVCDGSQECQDCKGPHSPKYGSDVCSKESARPKRPGNRCVSPKKPKTTCDKVCGCDGSQECKDCTGFYSPKHGIGVCSKESARPKKQESRCGSPKKPKTTCDKGCGCDGSQECMDCTVSYSLKHGSGICSKESARPKKQESRCVSPKKPKTTCDKGCGCDGSQECKDCTGSHSPKHRIDVYRKESARPKKQESRCGSPKKTKMTCDKGCGCDGSQECKDCVEPHSPRRQAGKCGQGPIKSTKQEARCKSPTTTKTTCDKACGCDGSSGCKECAEPHSTRYSKCGKESVRSKNRERSISPNTKIMTCDRGCGSDSSQNKGCNCKTGRCGQENSNSIKQDASLSKKFVNRCVQSTVKRVKSLYSHCNDSSDVSASTDQPCCSADSPTAKLVNKIKKECDKYQKRCRVTCKSCEASSSTTVSCDHCKRHCRRHKCRCHRTKSMERVKKKCVAYNLIVQTSDSMISEDTVFDRCRPLQNVVVRVPKCKQVNVPFKEACAKIEQKLPYCSTSFEPKPGRSQSWPNECGISSTDDVKMANQCTVREYLEKNRPDIVDRCATRQNCIRMISETRREDAITPHMNMIVVHTPDCTGCAGQSNMCCGARERSELREQMVGLGSLQSLNDEELIYLAKELCFGRRPPLQQKIISEREMKKHTEKIYKSLPEVIQKKEEAKKESIKKTNLLMANIFKKNLQKKTLSGDVNISNYSQVVKI